MRTLSPVGLAIVAATIGLTAGSAFAASDIQKACSTKYQAAKAGGTLNGMTYNQYYKQCAAEAKAQPATTTAPAATPAPANTTAATPAETKAEKKAEKKQEREEKKAEKAAEKSSATPTAAPAPMPAPAPATTTAAKPMPSAPVAAGSAVFPTAVSAEFSKESAGTARMHTCLAQYKINKTNNTNGGLKWIEKGGGYYSECNKRLKG